MIRNYRVVSSCFEPDLELSYTVRRDRLIDHLAKILESRKPDLVVLPELALIPDLETRLNSEAEEIDGPTISMVSGLAAEHSCSICMPIVEEDAGKKYNTAVYIDCKGMIAGKYRKHTPTRTELDLGISPGEDRQSPVILDGLRIGTAICYDENYPDLMWNWIDKGIDLLVFPSYTYAGKLMQSWALNCGVPLVAAFPWESAIYDRDGAILAEGGTWTSTIRFGHHPDSIAATLNMQSRIYHLDYNIAKISEMENRYGDNLDIKLMVREARFQLTVKSDDLSIEQVEEEMHLMPMHRYVADTRDYANRLRG